MPLRPVTLGALIVLAAAAPSAAFAQPATAPAQYDAATVDPWGIWADLAGTAWLDEAGHTSYAYAWDVAGEVMKVTVATPRGTFVNTLELDADGTAVNLRPDAKLGAAPGRFASPRPGVAVQTMPDKPNTRVVYRRTADRLTVTDETLTNGAWVPGQSRERRRAAPGEVEQLARTNADALAAEQARLAQDRDELARQWGVLGRIAGSYWKGEYYVLTWWAEPRRKLRVDLVDLQTAQRVNWFQFERDEKTGRLNETSAGYAVPYRVLADGSVYTDDGLNRAWRLNADGRLTLAKGDATGDTFAYKKDYMQPATRLSPDEQRALFARIQRAEQLARTPPQEAGSSGIGAFLGAAAGAALVGAAGGNTGQIVGGAFKGASIVDPGNEMSTALDAAGNQMLGGAATGVATGAPGAGAGAGARAMFPTKPNLASGTCPGFTMSNYQQKALEGGLDTQLKTMCGQAFEYYAMYKRAIAQGYSEADCNRTYAAHEQSAQVAASFARGQ